MLKGAFQHRSGRVISLARVVLLAASLAAIWMDPSQPSRHHAETYVLLVVYLSGALLYLFLTWSNWWLEARLAPALHAGDLALFGLIVFLTEGYTSPFFAFSVFILLSAMIKWGWRETAVTAAAVLLIFLAAGFVAHGQSDQPLDLTRTLFRGTHLGVVSALLIWFGFSLAEGRAPARPAELRESDEDEGLPIRAALDHAQAATGATRVLFAWWDKEEPWIHVASLAQGTLIRDRHGFAEFPAIVAAGLEGRTFLFDQSRRRVLLRRRRRNQAVVLGEPPVGAELAARYGLCAGLAAPVEAGSQEGLILAIDVPGLCADDLMIGERVGAAVSAWFDRAARATLAEESAATRTRLSLARDLHDSVVQLLAGTAFRLEGIRKSAASRRGIDAEIDALQRELNLQQRDLRTFIGELREGRADAVSADLAANLPALLQRMERQWGIECALAGRPDSLHGDPQLDYEIQQLVREGVANAVRHGRASRVTVSLRTEDSQISLVIADNGCGFPVLSDALPGENGYARPWSLDERVRGLRGELDLKTGPDGSRVLISLPAGHGAAPCGS